MVKKVLIISSIVVILLFTNIMIVFAATKSELEQQSQNIQNQIKNTEKQLF